jgi:hypothetical protein
MSAFMALMRRRRCNSLGNNTEIRFFSVQFDGFAS